MAYLHDYSDKSTFYKSVDQNGGNKFAAILDVSKKARNLMKKNKYIIRDSEALTAVLSDKLPECIEVRKRVNKNRYENMNIDVLDNIDDDKIKFAVNCSIQESVKNKHLIYLYKGVSECDKTRVRILCRMIWDSIVK